MHASIYILPTCSQRPSSSSTPTPIIRYLDLLPEAWAWAWSLKLWGLRCLRSNGLRSRTRPTSIPNFLGWWPRYLSYSNCQCLYQNVCECSIKLILNQEISVPGSFITARWLAQCSSFPRSLYMAHENQFRYFFDPFLSPDIRWQRSYERKRALRRMCHGEANGVHHRWFCQGKQDLAQTRPLYSAFGFDVLLSVILGNYFSNLQSFYWFLNIDRIEPIFQMLVSQVCRLTWSWRTCNTLLPWLWRLFRILQSNFHPISSSRSVEWAILSVILADRFKVVGPHIMLPTLLTLWGLVTTLQGFFFLFYQVSFRP